MESNALHYFCITFSRYFLNMSRAWLFVFNTISYIYSKYKSPFTPNSVLNKPQSDGRVNHVCTEEHRRRFNTLSVIKNNNEAQLLNVKTFWLLVMLNWIIKGQQQTHRLIKWDSIHLCCLTYLIIAGLHHILSLHFTVLIPFDEYWICFLRVGWINKHSHLV